MIENTLHFSNLQTWKLGEQPRQHTSNDNEHGLIYAIMQMSVPDENDREVHCATVAKPPHELQETLIINIYKIS